MALINGQIMLCKYTHSSCNSTPSLDINFRFLGIFASLLIPETKRKTLEELTGKYLRYITKSRRGTLPSDGGRIFFRKFGAEVLEQSS